jgi:hypothetical protein
MADLAAVQSLRLLWLDAVRVVAAESGVAVDESLVFVSLRPQYVNPRLGPVPAALIFDAAILPTKAMLAKENSNSPFWRSERVLVEGDVIADAEWQKSVVVEEARMLREKVKAFLASEG